jgi:tripartite-type tricarboxylate transporter receptor subunit TctC
MKIHKLVMLVLSSIAINAFAAYPDKPITLVVPVPPGGILDAVARMIAPEISLLTEPGLREEINFLNCFVGGRFYVPAHKNYWVLF